MGGLLSGIDQSLISGANLFMPACKSSLIISDITLAKRYQLLT
jgi:hypothetical protein